MESSVVVPTPAIKLKLKNVKTCIKCGTSDTPLWRNGPEGPKSMCNACGIRWKRANTPKNKKKLITVDDYHKIPPLSANSIEAYEIREKSFPEEYDSDNSDLYSHAEETEEAFDYYDEVQAPEGSPRGTPVASDSKEETHPSLDTLELQSNVGSSDSKFSKESSEITPKQIHSITSERVNVESRKRKEAPRKLLFSKRNHKHQRLNRIHSESFLRKQAEEEKLEGNPLFFQVAFYELQRVCDQMHHEQKVEQLNDEIEKLKDELKKRTKMVWELHSFASKCQNESHMKTSIDLDKGTVIMVPVSPTDVAETPTAPDSTPAATSRTSSSTPTPTPVPSTSTPSTTSNRVEVPYRMGANEIVLNRSGANMVPVQPPTVITDK